MGGRNTQITRGPWNEDKKFQREEVCGIAGLRKSKFSTKKGGSRGNRNRRAGNESYRDGERGGRSKSRYLTVEGESTPAIWTRYRKRSKKKGQRNVGNQWDN